MSGGLTSSHFLVGSRAEKFRGLLKLSYPLTHGIVQDWEDMDKIWHYAFEELHSEAKQHPVLLTEAPLNPTQNREKAAEKMFETFGVPALYVSLSAMLTLYASGVTSGVVLDCGEGVSQAVPVSEGFVIPSALQRADYGGKEVTAHLTTLLRRAGHPFHSTSEAEIVREMKEKVCYIANDPRTEEQRYVQKVSKREPVGMRDKAAASMGCEYALPDGHRVQLDAERFRAAEVMFDPTIAGTEYRGVHQLVSDAISLVDIDLRRPLCGQIFLSGGSTLFRGFGERLLREMRTLLPPDVRIKLTAPHERKYSPWIGGSILASLDSFRSMWVTHKQYAEEGPRCVTRNLF